LLGPTALRSQNIVVQSRHAKRSFYHAVMDFLPKLADWHQKKLFGSYQSANACRSTVYKGFASWMKKDNNKRIAAYCHCSTHCYSVVPLCVIHCSYVLQFCFLLLLRLIHVFLSVAVSFSCCFLIFLHYHSE